MNWFLIINDAKFRKEFQRFLKQNASSVLFKTEAGKAFKTPEFTQHAVKPRHHNGIIAVNSSNQVHLLKIKTIMHCRSSQSYTQFHLKDGKKITATKPLKQFEDMLKLHGFARVHQSHLVNIHYIDRYVKGTGGYLVLNDGTELPVAARKKEYLLREFENL